LLRDFEDRFLVFTFTFEAALPSTGLNFTAHGLDSVDAITALSSYFLVSPALAYVLVSYYSYVALVDACDLDLEGLDAVVL